MHAAKILQATVSLYFVCYFCFFKIFLHAGKIFSNIMGIFLHAAKILQATVSLYLVCYFCFFKKTGRQNSKKGVHKRKNERKKKKNKKKEKQKGKKGGKKRGNISVVSPPPPFSFLFFCFLFFFPLPFFLKKKDVSELPRSAPSARRRASGHDWARPSRDKGLRRGRGAIRRPPLFFIIVFSYVF